MTCHDEFTAEVDLARPRLCGGHCGPPPSLVRQWAQVANDLVGAWKAQDSEPGASYRKPKPVSENPEPVGAKGAVCRALASNFPGRLCSSSLASLWWPQPKYHSGLQLPEMLNVATRYVSPQGLTWMTNTAKGTYVQCECGVVLSQGQRHSGAAGATGVVCTAALWGASPPRPQPRPPHVVGRRR